VAAGCRRRQPGGSQPLGQRVRRCSSPARGTLIRARRAHRLREGEADGNQGVRDPPRRTSASVPRSPGSQPPPRHGGRRTQRAFTWLTSLPWDNGAQRRPDRAGAPGRSVPRLGLAARPTALVRRVNPTAAGATAAAEGSGGASSDSEATLAADAPRRAAARAPARQQYKPRWWRMRTHRRRAGEAGPGVVAETTGGDEACPPPRVVPRPRGGTATSGNHSRRRARWTGGSVLTGGPPVTTTRRTQRPSPRGGMHGHGQQAPAAATHGWRRQQTRAPLTIRPRW